MKNIFLIIHYNDIESTREIINNIKDYKVIDEIVIVDNYSTDGSSKLLQSLKNNKIKIIKAKENKGYSAGINLGLRYILNMKKEINIIISNSDIIIKEEKDLITLISALKNKQTGIIGPTIIENKTKNRGWKIPSPTIDCGLSIPFISKRCTRKYLYYKESHYKTKMSKVEAVSGCFFLIRSDVIKDIGLLDENVFLYYEENILGTKLKEKQYKCYIINNVEIIHNHSVTIDKNLKKINKLKILKYSQEYFEKNYNKADVLERTLLFIINKIILFLYRVIGIFRK